MLGVRMLCYLGYQKGENILCYIFNTFRKFPDLFMSLKVLLGFREPGLSEQLTAAAMAAVYMPKERVTADLAAEIGQ